jgi:dienelactone hydrolase
MSFQKPRSLFTAVAATKAELTESLPIDFRRRRLVGTALVLTAPSAFVHAAAEVPSSAPRFREIEQAWYDPDRSRSVPAKLYWPIQSYVAPSLMPLVVFSHGLGSSRSDYSYLGKHWASNGWASMHVQHVGSDSALWRGNPFQVMNRVRGAVTEQEAIHRVHDVHFALDQLLASRLGPQVDPARIVMAGHSFGANTALLAVGARVMRGESWLDVRDPRFAAAVIISAPRFYGETDLLSVFGQVCLPTLHITATGDVIDIPGFISGEADRVEVYDAVAGLRKTLIIYEGGSHSMFSDSATTGGYFLNQRVKAATRELSMVFFRHTFGGEDRAFDDWTARWTPILATASAARLV